MTDVIEPFFAQLATRRSLPWLRDISGTCRWNIEGAGSWDLSFKEGTFTINRDSSEARADCIITCSRDDFVRMIQGQQNPLTAFLQGRITVTGNVGLAQLCAQFITYPSNLHQQPAGG
jgi:hypothetical protein